MAAIPKPFRITTATLYARFNVTKSDDEVKAYLLRLKTKGVGLFDSVNTSADATPAKVLLSQGREKVLWEVLEHPEYQVLDLTQIHGKMTANLIGAAAKVNNTGFIQEWARRGLPLQDKAWSATPLSLAIDKGHTASVQALDEAGADWFGEYGAEATTQSWSDGWKAHKVRTKAASAWALALASPVSEITKIALGKKSSLTSKDWGSKVFIKLEKGHEKIKLSQLVGKILGEKFSLTPPPEVEEKNQRWKYEAIEHYKEAWWKAWRLSGVMEQFKALPEAQDINWAKVYDGVSAPNHVYRALAVGVEKPVTPEALRQCIDAIAKRKNKNELMSHMTAARAKALWDEKSPLAHEVYAKHVQVTYSAEHTMPLFPSVVLRNIRVPMLWKDGANNPKLAQQFWNALKDRHANVWDQPHRAGGKPFSSNYGIPGEFDVSASKAKRQAAYKTLDAMSQDEKLQEILPVLLKEMLQVKNTEFQGKKAVSGDLLLGIAVPILWGIERGLLNAKDTHEFILANQENVSVYRKQQSEEWISQIERYRLTAKIATKVDIPKPTFDGAL